MATSISILPKSYDIEYIIEQAGVVNHYGFEEREDGIHFKYRLDDYDAIQNELDVYPTKYLAIALPKRIDELIELKKQKVLGFTFGGMPIVLDETTLTNISGCVLGLERNPVDGIDWHLGQGVYIFIPREQMFAIADSAFLHVQGCFSRQKRLMNDLREAKDIFELDDIDLNTDWPTDPLLG